MGQVIDLRRWRQEHPDVLAHERLRRLERAVRRLDPAVTRVTTADGTVDPCVETELRAITGAVSTGRTDEALERAERLADRLEHPTARRR